MSKKNCRLSIAKVRALLPLMRRISPQHIRIEQIALKSGKVQSKIYVEDNGEKKPLNSSTFHSLREAGLILLGTDGFNDYKDEKGREVKVVLYFITNLGENKLVEAIMINAVNRLANLIPDPLEDETVEHLISVVDEDYWNC